MKLFGKRDRFQDWIEHDDGPKETYLAEIGGSWVDDDVALERVNAEYAPRNPDGTIRPTFTEATVRTWVRDDEEFAAALKVAIQMRAEARLLGTVPKRNEGEEPTEPETPPVTPQGPPPATRFIPLEDMPPQRRR